MRRQVYLIRRHLFLSHSSVTQQPIKILAPRQLLFSINTPTPTLPINTAKFETSDRLAVSNIIIDMTSSLAPTSSLTTVREDDQRETVQKIMRRYCRLDENYKRSVRITLLQNKRWRWCGTRTTCSQIHSDLSYYGYLENFV